MQPRFFVFLLLIPLLGSCKVYRQNIMFQTGDYPTAQMMLSVSEAERNYVIQPNDYLDVRLFANKGEKVIDFNINTGGQAAGTRNNQAADPLRFLVEQDGTLLLPLIGQIRLAGYTLRQADSVLAVAYNAFYEDAFVITRFLNKRVVVLGATGNQVVPLTNERMTVIEVLALSGGVTNSSKVHNIRLLRGDLNRNPQVYQINLSTIAGMKQSQLAVQPGDVIYVEPVRKALLEGISDITPVLSIFTTILTLFIVFRQ